MSTDTPITAALDCPEPKYAQEIQFDGARYFAVSPEDYEQLYESHLKLERENARLREELAEAKREIEQRGELANRHAKAYADAQARALEYKTEHAALLGTSQWQEVEIADLRDDVNRHMRIASECEERALAAEKDKKQLLTRLVDALESAVDWAGYASEYFREKHQHQLDIDKLDAARDELAAIDAAIGAKHD